MSDWTVKPKNEQETTGHNECQWWGISMNYFPFWLNTNADSCEGILPKLEGFLWHYEESESLQHLL